MQFIPSPVRARVSCEKYGSGPPLVLVHGGFSDHESNWESVRPFLESEYTVYAVARRGRGETPATRGHSVEDESLDVVSLLQQIGESVFLLGHSYGAQVALGAAAMVPELVRKLVLYEAPWPSAIGGDALACLEDLARAGRWDAFARTFFHDVLLVPSAELESLRASGLWPAIVADAEASLGDLRALSRYQFAPESYRTLSVPVLLQIGSESPRAMYVTDALAAVLPHVVIEELPGQAHEGMTTAPRLYADAVLRFLRT